MLKIETIPTISDEILILADLEIDQLERVRIKASQNLKFDKSRNDKALDFPSPNPAFVEYKKAIKEEISKRKLNTWR